MLNPSAVLRMNSVKDLILKLSHYHSDVYLDEVDWPLLASR